MLRGAMPEPIQLEFDHRPSALSYMAQALRARRTSIVQPPSITARWRAWRAPRSDLDDFLRLAGMSVTQALPSLFLHATSFRLQMAVLTHPAFPLAIWRVLQIRNRIRLRREVDPRAVLDLEVRLAATRILDKGAEVDLRCEAVAEGETVWASVNTFYTRGRFGAPRDAGPQAPAPAVEGDVIARWRLPRKGALRFGELTGDYNGIHLVMPYARLFGFRRAFAHPQRVLGYCLARLAGFEPDRPHELEAWLKGPVYYGAEVALRRATDGSEMRFAAYVEKEARPAIIGRLRRG